MNNDKISLYKILEIESNATHNQIKCAYKKLVLKYHPDKLNKPNIFGEDENKKFIEIKNAYDILSDPEKRRHYDDANNSYSKHHENYNINMFYADIKSLITNNEYRLLLKIIEKKINLSDKKDLLKNLENMNIMTLLLNNTVKILDINIQVEFSIRELYNNEPKKISYQRELYETFEEYIYPIDKIQIYENEGERIIINNSTYTGDLIINVLITNNYVYKNIGYNLVLTDLYVRIKEDEIKNNLIEIHYLDNLIHIFDLNTIEYTNSDIGKIYCIKDMGLPYYNTLDIEIDIKNCEIKRGNLFFIIII